MIGICVVYFIGNRAMSPLLDISIREIRRMTEGRHRIYGIVPGNDRATCRRLRRAGVTVLEAPAERLPTPIEEHSTLLTSAIERAIADGCSHIATFDMDSWPIAPGWDRHYTAALTEAMPLAAMVQTEAGTSFPFPGFCVFGAGFWASGTTRLLTPEHAPFPIRDAPSQRRETGTGLVDWLRDRGHGFLRLERSNAWQPHPVAAGVYDNAVFHMAGGSRRPRYPTDTVQYGTDAAMSARRLADHLNLAINGFVMDELQSDHDGFICDLTGWRVPLRPIPTPHGEIGRHLQPTPLGERESWPGTHHLGAAGPVGQGRSAARRVLGRLRRTIGRSLSGSGP